MLDILSALVKHMCVSVNDQRSLHGGVYHSGLVFNHCFCSVAKMYFQRVTERDSFQKCDGYRIRERTFHQR